MIIGNLRTLGPRSFSLEPEPLDSCLLLNITAGETECVCVCLICATAPLGEGEEAGERTLDGDWWRSGRGCSCRPLVHLKSVCVCVRTAESLCCIVVQPATNHRARLEVTPEPLNCRLSTAGQPIRREEGDQLQFITFSGS